MSSNTSEPTPPSSDRSSNPSTDPSPDSAAPPTPAVPATPNMPPLPPSPPLPGGGGPGSAPAAPTPDTSGWTTMIVFGYILIFGGILVAISPIIMAAIACRGVTDGGCGAGAIVVILTFPLGGLISVVGVVLVAIGSRKRMKLRNLAAGFHLPANPTGAPAYVSAPAAPQEPTRKQIRATKRAQWLLRPVVATAAATVAVGFLAIGAAAANTALQQQTDAAAFIGPIDLWFFAGLLLVCSVVIMRSLRKESSLTAFRSSLLLWQGIFITAWPFILLGAMGLPAAISDRVSNSFGMDDGTGGIWSPWGLLTGSSSGPLGAIFPCVAVGVTLIILSSKSSAGVPMQTDAPPQGPA